MNVTQNPKSATRKITKLKNGLTFEQVEKAKEVLAKVNVSEICRNLKVNRSTIENVLRDQSSQVQELKKVLVVANKQAKAKDKVLEELPL